MFKNNIKTAWRSIQKRKIYAAINIVVLTLSMAFVLLISAYVWQVYHVNSDLRNKDRQYILQSEYKNPGIGLDLTTIGALPKALKEEYPDLVANYYRMDGLSCILSNGEAVYEESVSLGDPTFLDMFGFELLEGDSQTALVSPNSMVITQAIAIKYFGRKEVLGENLTVHNFKGEKRAFVITGVLKPTRQNSVMELNSAMRNAIYLPIASEQYFGREIDSWRNLWIAAFIELQENIQPEDLRVPIETLLKQHADPQIQASLIARLNPLSTYYLDDNKGAVRNLTHILMCIGGFLLLMAVVNFINFTISQGFTRLKEIGVRKIMGAKKFHLTLQLIMEYMLLVCIAGFIALFLYPVLAPLFESIFLNPLPSLLELPFSFYAYFISLVILIGLLSSVYPSIKLSQNGLSESLKNQLSDVKQKHLVRHILLFTQFTVTIMVVVASVIVSQQINVFMQSNLGYVKDNLISVQVPRDWSEAGLQKMERIRDALRDLPYVEQISLSYGVPGSFGGQLQPVQKLGSEDKVEVMMIFSDAYFSDAYNIPLVAGAFFNQKENLSTDISKVVVNKKTANALGYYDFEGAIGKQISLFDNQFTGTIAGVTDDFHVTSLHTTSPPVVWLSVNASNQYRFFSIRLKAGTTREALASLEREWKRLLPESPFEFRFMDDRLKEMYTIELQLQRASQVASVLSILIIVLGLTGLTSLAIHLRLKEIGVRKVLGASLGQIIVLFSKEFYITFLLSILLATPLVYVIMNKWLSNYTIQAEVASTNFVFPILALVFLLFSIIASSVFWAMRVSPVKNLRMD